MKCFLCGCDVIWGNDFDTSDYGIDREGIVSSYSCSNCNTDYEVYNWFDEVNE